MKLIHIRANVTLANVGHIVWRWLETKCDITYFSLLSNEI